ncbi:MAG: hypothetical protein ABJG78_02920 [Cyclobacteriaceae bacterium]
MSEINYNTLLPVMEAIPDGNTLAPNMPVEKFLQEAANISVWSAEDRTVLEGVGVAAAIFDTLPARIGALRYAQSLWAKERHSKEEAQLQWLEQEPVAVDLKNQLEHGFRFAFRLRQDLLNKVQEIEEGNGKEDLVQDLSDLAVLGLDNLSLLEAVNFDVTQLQVAGTLSGTMSTLLAEVNGEKADSNISKLVRDKAYTYLKASVDEIRGAGKYVFWKDDKRRKGYLSFQHR